MSLREVAEALRAAEAVRVFVSLDLIEEVAAQKTQYLEAEALRTIRQKDLEKGTVCLHKIDGVADLLYALKQAANSMTYRQRDQIIDKREPTVVDRIAEIGKRRRRNVLQSVHPGRSRKAGV